MRSSLILSVLALMSLSSILSAQNGELGLKTVVIDAGHGGKDPGCISADGKTQEKTLTLELSRLLEEKIRNAYPNLKVIRTRDSDKFVPLDERADIANRNHANLFISLHIDANNSSAPRGYSTLILGQSRKGKDLFSNNMDICRRENSVILLEEDYSTKYQGYDPGDPESFIFFNLMQNAFYEQSLMFAAHVNNQMSKGPFNTDRGIFQEPILVLWKTTMPAVLIESGFISNKEDLKILRDGDCLDKIAQTVFYAFCEFKDEYDSSLHLKPEPVVQNDVKETEDKKVEETPEVSKVDVQPSPVNEVRYGIQVLASSKKMLQDDPFFKGHTISVYQVGNIYKYIAEESSDINSLVDKLKIFSSEYGDVFIVKITEGEVSYFRK